MHGKVNFFPLVMMVRWPPPGCRIIVIFPVNKPMADFSLRRVSVTFEGIATIRCHRAGRDISGQSFRLIPGALVVTDLRKARPTDVRRRYQRERHDGLAQTGPLNNRSAAGNRKGRRVAIRARPPLPSKFQVKGRQCRAMIIIPILQRRIDQDH
jgi:hypothetical protein